MKLAVEQCAIRLRILHHDWKLAQYQAEQEKMRSLLKQQSELEQEVAGLHVKSPRAGQVIARNLEDLVGQYPRLSDLSTLSRQPGE